MATLFTLIFIPAVYTILDDLKTGFWKVRPINLEEATNGETKSRGFTVKEWTALQPASVAIETRRQAHAHGRRSSPFLGREECVT